MSKEPVYWKTRNGRLISVDDMDINHLRNLTIKGQDSLRFGFFKDLSELKKSKEVQLALVFNIELILKGKIKSFTYDKKSFLVLSLI